MKKTVMLLFVVLTVSAAFAGGKNEDQNKSEEYTQEVIQVEGPLAFGEEGEPYVEQDGVKYLIRIPFAGSGVPDVKEGDMISVEGYVMPMNRFWNRDTYRHLMVIRAEINGEEFEISEFGGRFGGMPGPMGPGGKDRNPRGMVPRGGGNYRWEKSDENTAG